MVPFTRFVYLQIAFLFEIVSLKWVVFARNRSVYQNFQLEKSFWLKIVPFTKFVNFRIVC